MCGGHYNAPGNRLVANNERSRKTLGFETPTERFDACVGRTGPRCATFLYGSLEIVGVRQCECSECAEAEPATNCAATRKIAAQISAASGCRGDMGPMISETMAEAGFLRFALDQSLSFNSCVPLYRA
jgi:hypothetical protein